MFNYFIVTIVFLSLYACKENFVHANKIYKLAEQRVK